MTELVALPAYRRQSVRTWCVRAWARVSEAVNDFFGWPSPARGPARIDAGTVPCARDERCPVLQHVFSAERDGVQVIVRVGFDGWATVAVYGPRSPAPAVIVDGLRSSGRVRA